MSKYEMVSPLDYRYASEEVKKYFSEEAFIHYKLAVELALVRVLHKRGVCPHSVAEEVALACAHITAEEVYKEEDRIKHDIRALVNCIQRKVSEKSRPFVHMTATSFDISDTANAARYRDGMDNVILPHIIDLERALIELAEREAHTPQIGRTHGQHAVPITFGFTVASYVSRLGGCIMPLKHLAWQLVGKFSGAVGAYNASSLFFDDPRRFECEVLEEMDLKPADHSTQIVPPEPLARLINEIALAAGVIANLARDMRHLQRTEIDEVTEEFGSAQVGSSTMAHKRNPINWENIESMWKIICSRQTLILMDTVSEHQRDLTGSASARTYGEIFGYFDSMLCRACNVVKKLTVVQKSMKRNIALTKGKILAEPLYLLLAAYGHPDAHEKSRKLSNQAHDARTSLTEAAKKDEEFISYLKQFTPEQQAVLASPSLYCGKAAEQTLAVTAEWRKNLGLS